MPADDRSEVDLIRHPKGASHETCSIRVAYRLGSDRMLDLRYLLKGPLGPIRVPAARAPARADELWKQTCFEAFVAVDGSAAYFEFNLSPSTEWASYRFGSYRSDRAVESAVSAPGITVDRSADRLQLDARLALDTIESLRGRNLHLALAAVVESDSGTLSYWALAHPRAEPDFHHADGFRISLR
ncbi:MAG TPA: DOMON-like domain-containing protein [Steroidobacteraceae bacterium]|nr:DOMON-like domain-containing protein [Steroidobacteraceae bacterium]